MYECLCKAAAYTYGSVRVLCVLTACDVPHLLSLSLKTHVKVLLLYRKPKHLSQVVTFPTVIRIFG
jgi:hypothetical protein